QLFLRLRAENHEGGAEVVGQVLAHLVGNLVGGFLSSLFALLIVCGGSLALDAIADVAGKVNRAASWQESNFIALDPFQRVIVFSKLEHLLAAARQEQSA